MSLRCTRPKTSRGLVIPVRLLSSCPTPSDNDNFKGRLKRHSPDQRNSSNRPVENGSGATGGNLALQCSYRNRQTRGFESNDQVRLRIYLKSLSSSSSSDGSSSGSMVNRQARLRKVTKCKKNKADATNAVAMRTQTFAGGGHSSMAYKNSHSYFRGGHCNSVARGAGFRISKEEESAIGHRLEFEFLSKSPLGLEPESPDPTNGLVGAAKMACTVAPDQEAAQQTGATITSQSDASSMQMGFSGEARDRNRPTEPQPQEQSGSFKRDGTQRQPGTRLKELLLGMEPGYRNTRQARAAQKINQKRPLKQPHHRPVAIWRRLDQTPLQQKKQRKHRRSESTSPVVQANRNVYGQPEAQSSRRTSSARQSCCCQAGQRPTGDDEWPPMHLTRNQLVKPCVRQCGTTDYSSFSVGRPAMDNRLMAGTFSQWPPQSLPWPRSRIQLTIRAGEATCRQATLNKQAKKSAASTAAVADPATSANAAASRANERISSNPTSSNLYWTGSAAAHPRSKSTDKRVVKATRNNNSNNSNANNSSTIAGFRNCASCHQCRCCCRSSSVYRKIRSIYSWTKGFSDEQLMRQFIRPDDDGLRAALEQFRVQVQGQEQPDERLFDSKGGRGLYSLTERLCAAASAPSDCPSGATASAGEPQCERCRRERVYLYQRDTRPAILGLREFSDVQSDNRNHRLHAAIDEYSTELDSNASHLSQQNRKRKRLFAPSRALKNANSSEQRARRSDSSSSDLAELQMSPHFNYSRSKVPAHTQPPPPQQQHQSLVHPPPPFRPPPSSQHSSAPKRGVATTNWAEKDAASISRRNRVSKGGRGRQSFGLSELELSRISGAQTATRPLFRKRRDSASSDEIELNLGLMATNSQSNQRSILESVLAAHNSQDCMPRKPRCSKATHIARNAAVPVKAFTHKSTVQSVEPSQSRSFGGKDTSVFSLLELGRRRHRRSGRDRMAAGATPSSPRADGWLNGAGATKEGRVVHSGFAASAIYDSAIGGGSVRCARPAVEGSIRSSHNRTCSGSVNARKVKGKNIMELSSSEVTESGLGATSNSKTVQGGGGLDTEQSSDSDSASEEDALRRSDTGQKEFKTGKEVSRDANSGTYYRFQPPKLPPIVWNKKPAIVPEPVSTAGSEMAGNEQIQTPELAAGNLGAAGNFAMQPQVPTGVPLVPGKTTIQVLRFHNPSVGRPVEAPLRIRPPRFLSQHSEMAAIYSDTSGLLNVVLRRGNYSNSAQINEARRREQEAASDEQVDEKTQPAANRSLVKQRELALKAASLMCAVEKQLRQLQVMERTAAANR